MTVYRIQSTGFSGAMKLHIPYDTPSPTASYSISQINSANQGSNVTSGNMMGHSIAENEKYILVGCPNFSHSGFNGAGAAFLFEKTPDGILERKIFTSKYPEENGHFGWSVSMVDTILAIGAPDEGQGKGAVYTWLFDEKNLDWIENYFVPYDTDNSIDIPDSEFEISGKFGYSVAVSNNILVVGAPEAFGSGTTMTKFGAVYVYKWHMYSRRWEMKNKLQPSNTQDGSRFGFCVSLDSDLGIAVGSPFEDVNSITDNGCVYIYYPTNESWSQTCRLLSNTNVQNGYFGHSLDFQAGKLLIGAPGWSGGGCAFYWSGYWDSFSQISQLQSSDNSVTTSDNQGVSVSQDTLNGILYVGNSNNDSNKGCVYAYEISHGEIVHAVTHKLQANNVSMGDHFGSVIFGSPNRLTVSSPNAATGGFWYTFKKS